MIEDSLRMISRRLTGVLEMEAASRRISPSIPGPQDTVEASRTLRDSLHVLLDQVHRLSDRVQSVPADKNGAATSSETTDTWKDKLSLYLLILCGVLVREIYKGSDGNLRAMTISEAVEILDIKTFGGALVLSAVLFAVLPPEGANAQTFSEAFMTGLAWNTVLEMILPNARSSSGENGS